MNDLFEDLKPLIKMDVPEVDDSARQRTKILALESFDENFSKNKLAATQGNDAGDRLTHKSTFWAERVKGWKTMTQIFSTQKLAPTLIGGASLAVIAMVAVQSGLLRLPNTMPDFNQTMREEIASEEIASKDLATPSENDGALGEITAHESPVMAPVPTAGSKKISPTSPQRLLNALGVAKNETLATRSFAEPVPAPFYQDIGRDKHKDVTQNNFQQVTQNPVSTFSIDVDTAAYSFMRGSLNRGILPTKNAIRVEELINYFPYDYQGPKAGEAPFSTSITVLPTPWNSQTKLLHIAIKGYDIKPVTRPATNLTFLLDTSGSMNAPDKLPLLINSFKMLLSSLSPDDTVSIVTYAGSAGTVLEATKVSQKSDILNALERLQAGGSTAGGEGIIRAYQLAEQNFVKGGVNRIILATDGDFNVGISNEDELKNFVERKRETGVFLSVLGFGHGNYNDSLMQTLAQNGNGVAAYIDTLNEARKVLVEEASSSLFTIANDVKIQMEFNANLVSEYRLIGYETRALETEDFNNDKVDAGDIGSGHSVTAIYEFTPVGNPTHSDPLRYNAAEQAGGTTYFASEYGFLKLRYKQPGESQSKLIEQPITAGHGVDNITNAGIDIRFATSVAAFGQLLQGGKYTGTYTYDDVIELAQRAKGQDMFGYRAEFITLVRLAKTASLLETR